MRPQSQLLGQKGEQLAVDYLIKNNYLIISRNYRYGKSEIDIVCQKNDTIIFCEVKSCQSKPLDALEFRVNRNKQQQLIRGAYGFIGENPQFESQDIRFDVIIVDFSVYPVNIVQHQAAFWLEKPF